jgi:hypothetical protein
MSYSRKQLEALGEPLGDSVTRKEAGRIVYGMGGGGGSQNVTQTTSNIPKYFQPQAEALIGAATQQLFRTEPDGQGGLNIVGMRSYVPYSGNPADYVAGFTPLQQYAQANAANLQVPGQFNTATGMGEQAGYGGLTAGARYAQQATDPGAIQAYMSPYMQNIVAGQQREAQRQADIATQTRNAQFARAGAFGGGRQAVENAEAARNLAGLKNSIYLQGQQKAFEDAQQAQQFGADLGLRGQGLAGQMSGQLANIGSAQLAGQTGILNLQNMFGGQQQQQLQNIINQAISNYAQQQEYPMQQLNQYSGLLRGYMTPGSTTTQYMAPPSLASQAAGVGLGAYGLSQLGGLFGGAKGAKGGQIKNGGIEQLAMRNALKGGKQ